MIGENFDLLRVLCPQSSPKLQIQFTLLRYLACNWRIRFNACLSPAKNCTMKGLLLLVFGFVLAASVQGQLRINEFMAVNESVLADGNGSFDDWIEIYNAGDSAVCLNGYSLSDDAENLQKFKFKSRCKQSLIVPPQGYLLIWCDEDQLEGLTHANFRLAAAGEFLALSDAQGKLIDSVSFGPQSSDVSMGRDPQDPARWEIQRSPTPCESNSTMDNSTAWSLPALRLLDLSCRD